ncbi:hypothetical protein L6164_025048 [Bauhinia variegata]|uniref:Uncharacterized protein n=1 Tax=Bauhinia variegata TaxID=167791 RepID=A0ACB9M2F3_BAUVA|nr:hypothetical protein L6164_025048 [Bauhinia variegata]
MGDKTPYLIVVLLQVIYAGMILLSKAVLNQGMKSCVFIFYRQLVGTIVLVPLAIIFEGRSALPISFVTFCKIFMLSFIGISVSLNVYAMALTYTSATLGAAIINTLPVSTFFFATLLRMEKVKIRTKPGIAKVAGLVVCMGGVGILALYKGPRLKPLELHHLLSGPYRHSQSQYQYQDQDDFASRTRWILGSLLLFCAIISWGFWLVIQARLLQSYPSKLTLISLQCFFSSIQSFGIAVALERDFQQWKLEWNVRLLAVLYCGTMVTGLSYYMQVWVIQKKGPVFLATWNPLSLVLTLIGSTILLGEAVRLGSVLGGILLVLSLYCVLWAKTVEERSVKHNVGPLPLYEEKQCSEVKEAEPTTPPKG